MEWRNPEELDSIYGIEYKLEPGMLIKTFDDEIELVGTINQKAGVCDCCSWISLAKKSNDIKGWAWFPSFDNKYLEK